MDRPATDGSWYLIDNAGDVSSPALLIYPDRIEDNIRMMIKIAGNVNRLRPHVKTHKMPEIVRMQMNAGITRFKCATISEAEMVARCGVTDILLAMQPVGPNLERFFRLKNTFPRTKFSCLTDSEDLAEQLSRMAADTGMETNVWIDINNGMNRSGIEPGDSADSLIHKIAGLPLLNLEGLHVYDGHIRESDITRRKELSNQAFAPVTRLAGTMKKAGIDQVKIIAGGTTTFPVHALRQNVECSPGTTLLWDYGYSSLFPDMAFRHAALLFTRIVSKPSKNMICLDLGHKAIASEMPHPRLKLIGIDNYHVINHSEEHLVIETPGADGMRIGEHLYGIPFHICPTVDRYDVVSVVSGHKVTGQWNVAARKRKITI